MNRKGQIAHWDFTHDRKRYRMRNAGLERGGEDNVVGKDSNAAGTQDKQIKLTRRLSGRMRDHREYPRVGDNKMWETICQSFSQLSGA